MTKVLNPPKTDILLLPQRGVLISGAAPSLGRARARSDEVADIDERPGLAIVPELFYEDGGLLDELLQSRCGGLA